MNRQQLSPFIALMLAACQGGAEADPTPTATPDDEGSGGVEADGAGEDTPATEVEEAPTRIVAIGDVHGDLGSAREALQLAGAIDENDRWVGGELVVVQVGDQLDRGDDEREILDLFEQLRAQAEAAGGGFHPLLGNHEIMNIQIDLRYVTPGGFEDFDDIEYDPDDAFLQRYEPAHRGRVAAFRPGGPYANILAEHEMVFQLDGTVFVHGGLIPLYANLGVDRINELTSAWMRGETPEPSTIQGEECPIWSRHFSNETDDDDCALLEETLEMLDAQRMVVGHTVQDTGITSACDGRVWRVDVGLADYYGGSTQVLEIVGDRVRPILAAQR